MATEQRLIYVDALKKAIMAEPWKEQINAVRLTVDYINIIIDEQPTVEAVTLPCKANRSVYVLDGGDVIGMIVHHFKIYANTGAWAVLVDSIVGKPERKITVNVKAFGKTVFLTRKEAEAKMDGGVDNG